MLKGMMIQVEETAGCSGDYLQFGRDTFIVTDRTSPKFCNKVTPKKKTKVLIEKEMATNCRCLHPSCRRTVRVE